MAKQAKVNTDQPLKRTGAKQQLAKGQKPKTIGKDRVGPVNGDSGTEEYFKKVKDTGYNCDEGDIAQGFTRIPA